MVIKAATLFALMIWVVACGDDDPTADCATRCAMGCCDAKGNCFQGQDDGACGFGGGVCQSCPAGSICSDGRCLRGGGCTAQSCAGCCTFDDRCILQTDDTNCGARGSLCVACAGGKSCVAGRCSASQCVPETCGLGCCAGDRCVEMAQQSTSQCGRGGRTCTGCGGGQACLGGQCVSDRSCDANCEGCCSTSNKCVDPAQQNLAQCGKEGEACQICGGKQVCISGACVPEPIWQVRVERGLVADKDVDGKPWDSLFGDPLPDAYVCVGLIDQSSKKCSQAAANTTEPSWYEDLTTFSHTELTHSGLSFQLRDEDGAYGYPYEGIGGCSLFPTGAPRSGEIVMTGADCTGSVHELRVTLSTRPK